MFTARSLGLNRRVVSLLVTLALAAGGGCRRRETTVQLGDRLGVLHVGNRDEPRDLDPQIVFFNTDANPVRALFEGLVTADPETLRPAPGVAERWDVSPDGLVYTFHLRADARWSNGDPVTAQDFRWSYQRMLSPALGAELTDYLFDVRGARDFAQGRLQDFAQVGFRAPDPRTFEITLEHPAPYLLGLMYNNAWLPVHRATLEKFGRMDQRATGWTRPGNLVGNGPFVLAEWEVNQRIVVRRSPTYWNARNVGLNEVRFHPVADEDVEERLFRAGGLHTTYAVPVSKLETLRRTQPDALRIAPYADVRYLQVNTARPPLDDTRVRRALALALDRAGLAKDVLRAGETAADTYVPPATGGGYTPDPAAPLRGGPEAARRLLAEAGFPGGKGLAPVELLASGSPANRQILEAVQAMWERELGFRATIRAEESKVFQDSLNRRNFGLALLHWVADYDDPNSFLAVWRTGGTNNQSGWARTDYDDALDAAARAGSDAAARAGHFRRAEAMLLRDLPILPLYFGTRATLRQPSVRGWFDNPLDVHDLKGVSLRPEPGSR